VSNFISEFQVLYQILIVDHSCNNDKNLAKWDVTIIKKLALEKR